MRKGYKMVRLSTVDKVGPEVADAFNELMRLCNDNMVDGGDLLVTSQNGFIFAGNAAIGYGENLEDVQQLNLVTAHGIGAHTENDNYFTEHKGKYLNGDGELERTTADEVHRYLRVWENLFFLRVLTQLAHLLNHEHYDWSLDIRRETGDGRRKSNYIEKLLKRFSKAEKFYAILVESYNRNLRNADAHDDIFFVDDGFILRNIKPENGLQKGMSYEQWERVYIITYLLADSMIKEQRLVSASYINAMALAQLTSMPILVPCKDGKWRYGYVIPDKNCITWRFVR